jgi:hypothetical protein
MEITDRVAEGEVAPEDLLDEISIPGVPENTIEWEDYEGWSVPAKVTVKYLDQSTSMPVDFTTEANMPFRLSFANLAQGQRKTYVPTIRLEVQEPAHSWVGPGELRVNNDMESLYKMVGYGSEPDPDPYRFIR